jgi:hypothetical protein
LSKFSTDQKAIIMIVVCVFLVEIATNISDICISTLPICFIIVVVVFGSCKHFDEEI